MVFSLTGFAFGVVLTGHIMNGSEGGWTAFTECLFLCCQTFIDQWLRFILFHDGSEHFQAKMHRSNGRSSRRVLKSVVRVAQTARKYSKRTLYSKPYTPYPFPILHGVFLKFSQYLNLHGQQFHSLRYNMSQT